MKRNKGVKELAKKLVELSLDADKRISDERVSAVLEALRQSPPRNHTGVLREYLQRLKIELARSQAIIEFAGELSPKAMAEIHAMMTETYNRDLDVITRSRPDLIAGVRVLVGDDVYDSSAAGRLARLKASVQ